MTSGQENLLEELVEAIFHNGAVLVDVMGEALAWRDVHGNWHELPTIQAQPALKENTK